MPREDIPRIGPVLAYDAPEDAPEKQAAIETLLFALQELRAGRIDSVAFIAASDGGQRTMVCSAGVRDDMAPLMAGLASFLQSDLHDAWDLASLYSSSEDGPDSA